MAGTVSCHYLNVPCCAVAKRLAPSATLCRHLGLPSTLTHTYYLLAVALTNYAPRSPPPPPAGAYGRRGTLAALPCDMEPPRPSLWGRPPPSVRARMHVPRPPHHAPSVSCMSTGRALRPCFRMALRRRGWMAAAALRPLGSMRQYEPYLSDGSGGPGRRSNTWEGACRGHCGCSEGERTGRAQWVGGGGRQCSGAMGCFSNRRGATSSSQQLHASTLTLTSGRPLPSSSQPPNTPTHPTHPP